MVSPIIQTVLLKVSMYHFTPSNGTIALENLQTLVELTDDGTPTITSIHETLHHVMEKSSWQTR